MQHKVAQNTGSRRNIPTLSKVCPCDLLIVIEYYNRKGNCVRCSVKGRLASDGANFNLGISKTEL